MTASELASMLHARRHSGYWMASCPVHGHPTRSFQFGGVPLLLQLSLGSITRERHRSKAQK